MVIQLVNFGWNVEKYLIIVESWVEIFKLYYGKYDISE